jgi:DNA replication protein DnaC
MGYSREVYTSALQILQDRRRRAEEEAERRRSALRLRFPEVKETERLLASTAVAAARAVLRGGNAKESLQKLKEENQEQQRRLAELLQKAGMPEDGLEPHFTCPKCGDTGYLDGRMCSCLSNLLREEACRRLNALTPLSLSTFTTFSLDYYSDESENGRPSERETMGSTLRFCENYAERFGPYSANLILTGGTGLGKTHLSLAIANEAIQRGFGVVYGSAGNLVAKMESEHFGKDPEEETCGLLQSCDLLILDDLGTEFKSSFSSSAIYNVVNSRLMAQKPTIISTNLSTREMVEYYSERFASRIIGSFRRIVFVGKDVRQQKRMKGAR